MMPMLSQKGLLIINSGVFLLFLYNHFTMKVTSILPFHASLLSMKKLRQTPLFLIRNLYLKDKIAAWAHDIPYVKVFAIGFVQYIVYATPKLPMEPF